MSFIVKSMYTNDEREYAYLEDALYDIVDDDILSEILDGYYPQVEVAGRTFYVSEILKNCLSPYDWDLYLNDFIGIEANYINSELEVENELEYWGYKIIKKES